MVKRLNIYDINNSEFLSEDINDVIIRIGQLYEIHYLQDKIRFISKIKFPENVSWASNETNQKFNEAVPLFKSIIKDIYSIIEGVFVYKEGKFNKPKIEKKYHNLNILREFNNKLKHHNTKNVVFNLTSILNINQKTFDCWIQYKFEHEDKIKTIQLTTFFSLFYDILEKEGIIKIERV